MDLYNNNKDYDQCPISYTLEVLGGKWKIVILWHLIKDGIKRYAEIRQEIPAITHKMLSQQLKELEGDGLIARKQYDTIPPKVEYSITDKGRTVEGVIKTMYMWGLEQKDR